jgi:hypothetical protein
MSYGGNNGVLLEMRRRSLALPPGNHQVRGAEKRWGVLCPLSKGAKDHCCRSGHRQRKSKSPLSRRLASRKQSGGMGK